MRLDVTVEGADDVKRRFNGMLQRAERTRPLFEQISDDFRAQSDQVWRTQGAATGRRWKRLNPDYLKRKIRKGLGSGILENTSKRGGILRRSLTRARAKGSMQRVTRDSVELGTRIGIARIHQQGGTVPLKPPHGHVRRVRIPARPFVVVTDETRQRWSGLVADHLVDGRAPFNGRV